MRQQIINFKFILLHNDSDYYRHLLFGFGIDETRSPGLQVSRFPGRCFSRISLVAF